MPTFYEVLGVDTDALIERVKAAYKEVLLASHPDKTGKPVAANSGISIDVIKEAYRVLSSVEARKQYDHEIHEASKKQGFVLSGDGLDVYTLELFEAAEQDDGLPIWVRDCPRCTAQDSLQLLESDLENGTSDGSGGLQIVVPCLSCSLWITVAYEEIDD